MDVDSKVWVAIAAVTAASISAIISVVNMVISKDQKTTDFRQEWINSLRNEISNLIAFAKSVKSQGSIIGYINAKEKIEDEAIKHMMDAVKNHSKDKNNSHTKILLYLNPKEHGDMIDLVNELANIASLSNKTENEKVKEQCDNVIKEAQGILKKEWKRVKRGEVTFYLTKYILIVSMSSILFVALLKIAGIIDVSINLKIP